MHFKTINQKMRNRMFRAMEFYDTYGYLPFEKKKISISVSGEKLLELKEKAKKEKKPLSKVIEEHL